MARVNVSILRSPYQPAAKRGPQIESYRLLTDISLLQANGWGSFVPAIMDTGAPMSLLPRSMWSAAAIQPLERIRVGGLVRKAECMFDVTVGLVTLAIRDQINTIEPIKAYALLADHDNVPTLLGMQGILSLLRLHVEIANQIAYLEALG